MKRILAILLAALMVCSVLALCAVAEETELENQEIDIPNLEKAPVIDGEIKPGEYGKYPVNSFKLGNDNPGFKTSDCYELTDDPNLGFDFYAGWDKDNLYLAWKVNTKYDYRIPEGLGDGYMYQYCCVQFILTPGAPDKSKIVYQTAEWSGDYLEIGCCLKDDGQSYKVCWSQPAAADGKLNLGDWEFAGSREGDITTYEIRLPWNKTGVKVVGTDAKFGLTYAVGAQQHFDDVAMGMVEYQDAILFGKHADSAAICTMAGGNEQQKEVQLVFEDRADCPKGELPKGLKESIIIPTKLNNVVGGEKVGLITKVNNLASYGVANAYCVLLRPAEKIKDIEGYYTVVEGVMGNGAAPTFTEAFKEGDIIVAAHSDGSAGAAGLEARQALEALSVGQKVYIFGYGINDQGDLGFKYNNSCVIPINDPAAELFGTWYNDTTTIVFNEDKTGKKGDTDFAYTVSEDGTLKIDGKKVEWAVENGTLTLGEETYTKVTAADLSEINGLIALAEAKAEADYTAETYAAMTEALNAAKELVAGALDSRNQPEIDAAAEALNTALEALIKNEPEAESSEEPAASSEEPAAESSAEESKEEEGGLSTGAIIGIVIGAIVVVGGAAAGIILGLKKKK